MKFRTEQKGSILILTLWILTLLSVFTLSVGYSVRQRLSVVRSLETKETLRYVARAGVAKARAVLDSRSPKAAQIDAMNQDWAKNPYHFRGVTVGSGEFSVMKYVFGRGDARFEDEGDLIFGMVDEESKLNINTVTEPSVLTRFFRGAAKLDPQKAAEIAESLMDFIDPDDHSYPSGAESRYYRNLVTPYEPKNARLDRLEEMMMVKGMDEEIFRNAERYMTLYSSGQVNLNTASPVVLTALGVNQTLLKKILSYRRGRDQKMGTRDDGIFEDIAAVPVLLDNFSRLDETEKGILATLIDAQVLSVSSQHFQIRSVARVAGQSEAMMIICVVARYGDILQWQESFYSVPAKGV